MCTLDIVDYNFLPWSLKTHGENTGLLDIMANGIWRNYWKIITLAH